MNNINSQFLLTGSHYLISKVSSQISLEPLVAEMKNRSEMSGVLESYRALESGRFEFKFGKGFQSVSPPCRRYHLLCWVVFPTSYFCQLLFSSVQFSSVQSLSCVQLFATPWTAVHQASLSITNSKSLPKPMSIELVMPSNHLILCHPLFLLPPIFPSIRVFSKESAVRIRWPKYWSFSFSISPSNEYSGLTSFRMDWLDLRAVQGTVKSLLQHHSSKASIL